MPCGGSVGKLAFGQLWALNAETLPPGKGIPLHAHENMEIISIPLSGTLRHQDSRGAAHIMAPGDIHVLSAGLGVTHWEYNHSPNEPAHYLQAWISPKSRMTPTRYAQGTLVDGDGGLCLIAAPHGHDSVVEINQDAFVSLARLPPGIALQYSKYGKANGLHVFVIEGRLDIGGRELAGGCGLSLAGRELPVLQVLAPSRVLCIEVPLQPLSD
ncbi:MAG: pirin family protein [Gammaproteobacteria bacterium]